MKPALGKTYWCALHKDFVKCIKVRPKTFLQGESYICVGSTNKIHYYSMGLVEYLHAVKIIDDFELDKYYEANGHLYKLIKGIYKKFVILTQRGWEDVDLSYFELQQLTPACFEPDIV